MSGLNHAQKRPRIIFNFPRLDTLILGTPISDPGRVEQYVGRLNRDYPGKKNVVVYDYVDSHIYTFDNMYRKRLRTNRRIGYRVAADDDLRWLNIRAFPSEKLEVKDYVNTIEREY
jgi:superfamily II DNA or RNA helicase